MTRAAALAIFGLFGADLVYIAATRGHQSAGTLARGAAVAFFLTCVAAAVTAGALSLGGWLAARIVPPPERPLRERLAAFAFGGSEPERARRVGAILATLGLGAAYSLGLFVVARAIDERVVQSRFVALGVTGASLALLALCAAAAPPAQRAATRLARLVAPLPGLGWALRRPARLLGLLALAALVGAVGVTWAGWESFQHVPWGVVGRIAAGLALGAVAAIFAPGRRASVALALLALALFVPSAVVALGLSPAQQAPRELGADVSLAGAYGDALLHAAFDVDRDGHLPLLAGGDCAPFDPARHYGAVDVPLNGVDEDCDGRDAEVDAPLPLGRYDWPTEGFPRRPDVVLITIDALSARHLKANGYARSVAPRMDALARGGINFDSAFAQGPSTRLSFPSLFTSRWDSELPRAPGGRQPFPITCTGCQLAEQLARAGYRSEAVLPDPYFSRAAWPSLTNGFGRVSVVDGGADGFNSREVTDAAIAAFARVAAPRFVWAHYFDVHAPIRRPPEGARFGEAERDIYDAELAHLDAQVGRLIDAVRARSPGALIVLTSDHATAFHPVPGARKGHYGYDLYTSTLHVPLIFSSPALRAREVSGVVSLMDVTPTLLNLLGLRVSTPVRGESLVPELIDGADRPERRIFHQFYLPERRGTGEPLAALSLRTERYNLILEPETGRYQLFEWRRDYDELDEKLEAGEEAEAFAALRPVLDGYLRSIRTAPP